MSQKSTFVKILKFCRYFPLIIILNIFPLIRGCGDTGFSQSIGFPLPLASIEKSSCNSFEFTLSDVVVAHYPNIKIVINISVLLAIFLAIHIKFFRLSKILVSVPYQLLIASYMVGYLVLTPFTFLPSLLLIVPFAFVLPPIPDEILCDTASRLVFLGILTGSTMVPWVGTKVRQVPTD